MSKIGDAYIDGFVKAAGMPKLEGLKGLISKFRGAKPGFSPLDSMEGLEHKVPFTPPSGPNMSGLNSLEGVPPVPPQPAWPAFKEGTKNFFEKHRVPGAIAVGTGAGLAGLGLDAGIQLDNFGLPRDASGLTDPSKDGGINGNRPGSFNPGSIIHTIMNHIKNNKVGYGIGAGALAGAGGLAYLNAHHKPKPESEYGATPEPGSDEE